MTVPETMLAAALVRPGKFEVSRQPVPHPGSGELLVKTAACGICTSEIELWRGKIKDLEYPRFIGHEPSGEVVDVGAGITTFRAGDHVSVWSEGKGYAEYFVTPAAYAARLRPETPLEQALGEPIACCVNGVRKADPQFGDTVCMIGCGFMGLVMMQVFRARGTGLMIAVDPRQSMRELALRLGASHALDPSAVDVAQEVHTLTGGRGVDIGVEAGGLQSTLDLASSVVRMEGKLVVFGFHPGEPRTVDWGFWNWMAFQIVNGHVRSADMYVQGMTMGLTLLEEGKLQMEPLVTHRFRLEDIDRAFALASSKPEGFVKGVIAF